MTKKDEVNVSGRQIRIRTDLVERIEQHRRVLSNRVGVKLSLTLLVNSLLTKGLDVTDAGK